MSHKTELERTPAADAPPVELADVQQVLVPSVFAPPVELAPESAEGARLRLLSIDDLADYLQIPKSTLYRWRVDGKGPRGVRIGKYVRYRPEDVAAWVESHMREGS